MINSLTRHLAAPKQISVVLRRVMSIQSSHNVLHNKNQNMFHIPLEKGDALLEYNLEGNIIDMYHTEVPTAYRGQGIAKFLVQDALKYAADNGLKVRPTCSYVLKYVTDNPDPSFEIVK